MIDIGTLIGVIEMQDRTVPVIANAITNLRNMSDTTKFTAEQVRRLGETYNLSADAMSKLSGNTTATTAQMEKLGVVAKDVSQGIGGTAYQITLLGRGAMEAGVLLSGLSIAIGSVATSVIEMSGEFETQMTRVITLAGASREQVEEMRQSVLDLAGATAVGPSELAKGLYVLMSAQRSTTEAMEQLRVSAQMTALGMGNMHDTTLAVTGAVFAYRNQNLTAAQAANTLIKAVQLGNMEIQQLVPAIARVNPIAAAMGVTFEEVAATIATFTHAGVDAAMAATGVRAMLNNILTDSAKTEKGFAQLARITGDTTITMKNFRAEMKEKGMVQAMVDLSDAATRAGDEGTEALGKIFPNIRALTQALFVFKTNGGMVIDMMKEMRNGEDDLGNGTRELQKTWDWQWAQMKVSIEKLWISLGEKLMPIFKGLLDAMKAGISVFQWFVNVFNAMPLSLQAIVISFTALLTVLGPTLIVLGQLAMAVGNLMRGAVALQAMAGAAGLLGKSLMFLGGYWQWIIAGLVALGTVVIWYTQRTKVSIETINESTATNARHLESLKKIEKQLESSIVEHGTYADVLKRVNTAGSSLNFVMEETEKVQKRALDGSYGVRNGLISEAEAVQKNVDLQKDYHTIAAQIIQLNPATIGALTKERLAQQDLTKAINDTNSAKLQSEKIANDLRAKEIVNLKSLANEQQNTMTEALRVINTGTKYTTIRGGTIISSGVSTSEIDNAKTQYKLAEAALKEYNKQIDDNNTKFNETRESYDANFKALEDLRRSTEANAAAANNHTNTLTGQALAA